MTCHLLENSAPLWAASTSTQHATLPVSSPIPISFDIRRTFICSPSSPPSLRSLPAEQRRKQETIKYWEKNFLPTPGPLTFFRLSFLLVFNYYSYSIPPPSLLFSGLSLYPHAPFFSTIPSNGPFPLPPPFIVFTPHTQTRQNKFTPPYNASIFPNFADPSPTPRNR